VIFGDAVAFQLKDTVRATAGGVALAVKFTFEMDAPLTVTEAVGGVNV
jgi:hypothetical protein